MINLIHGDCIEKMKYMVDSSIDLTITSPPYDNLRTYNGSLRWNQGTWERVIELLYKITTKGGVVVWVVGDSTIKGSETGTSFKQALYFKEVGFNLHDTMIYQKQNYVPLTHKRYEQSFEYMFILSKGKPKTFNPIMIDCKNPGKLEKYGSDRRQNFGKNHSMRTYKTTTIKQTAAKKIKPNIFNYTIGNAKKGHPAPFPYELAHDHIVSWSDKGDTVLDPFMGSGTTGVACKDLNRNFIGIEKDKDYFKIAKKRINE